MSTPLPNTHTLTNTHCEGHLVLDGLPVLWLLDDRKLQFGHLLHLGVHVDVVQQRAALAAQKSQRVLLALTPGQQGGAGRVNGSHPVLQICLIGGLEEKRLFMNKNTNSDKYIKYILLIICYFYAQFLIHGFYFIVEFILFWD